MSTRIFDSSGADRAETVTAYQRVKTHLHEELVERLDLAATQDLPSEALERLLRDTLGAMLSNRELPISREKQTAVVDDIIDEMLGYGPIERLLRDDRISDILINGANDVWIEREGKLHETDVRFRDDAHVLQVIDRIVSAVGRRVDESSAMVDARLPDGSRFNAVIPPLAVDGPMVSIRRFGRNPLTADALVQLGALPQPLLRLLQGCVQAKLNILISGGTGSGKTTLLNAMSASVPDNERIVTIEDAAELRLQQRHVVRLESRPPNLEGQGEVTTRDLVRNSLRMRPDRIIVGEIRGHEAIDMLQAMNTGHEGSLSTIHANSPRHALRRVETMVGLGMGNIPGPAIREMIADALDLIIQVSRLSDGRRRVVSVTEIAGMEGQVVSTQEIFRFKQRTVEAGTGRVRGVFEATGVRPAFAARLQAFGIPVPPQLTTWREEV